MLQLGCGAGPATVADEAPVSEGDALSLPPPVCAAAMPAPLARFGDHAPALPDALDTALAMIDAERATFGLSADALASSKLDADDPRMLPLVRGALHHPISLPAFGRSTGRALDAALMTKTPVTSAIGVASLLRDAPIPTTCLDGAWLSIPAGPAPLASALAIDGAAVAGVPLDLQRALVPVVRAASAAAEEIEAARSGAPADLHEALASLPSYMLGIRHFEWSSRFSDALERVDTRRIAAAASVLAFAIERADLARFAGLSLDPVDLATPLGPIVLRGAGADTWRGTRSGEAPLLLIDTGGDDDYRAPVAAATLVRPVSVLVDLGGDDTYAYVEGEGPADDGSGRIEGRTRSRVGRQGSGVLGVGLLFDLGAGDDHYRSLVGSQGSGSHGVGALYDDGGDDRYEAEGFSQGAAAWGIGLLLDRAGADQYTLYRAGQGFGFSGGVGAVVDGSGDDLYVADPGASSLGGTAIYPSQPLPGANDSFAQGCGVGQRPDGPAPGYPLPGGIGILRDASGDDRYRAGVIAQGCGFVQGLGMLLEGAGADTYDGLYYVQAIGLHVGAGLLLESGGNDAYDTTYALAGPALGFAHDLAVAVLLDEAGDDVYRASTLAFGAAYANGAAVFADGAGQDRFTADSGDCFGAAFTADVRADRQLLPTNAIFVKTGGPGTYGTRGNAEARSDTTWRSRGAMASEVERGAAVDSPAGTLAF